MKNIIFCAWFLLSTVYAETVDTQHQVNIGKTAIEYRATLGSLPVGGDQGEISYVSYIKDNSPNRPLFFCFNGGPGSSSVWLHLGAFGPKRIKHSKEGVPQVPFQLEDNPGTLLDLGDLVFVDPVGTGFSKVTGEQGDFYSTESDVAAMADFIRLYTTHHGRWNSPIYIVGESYGTTRAAALADVLQSEHYLFPEGLILISSILDFQTVLDWNHHNILPYILNLPSQAAAAQTHNCLASDLMKKSQEELLAEVEAFAMGPYALALLQGNRLEEKGREGIAEALSRYTGLSVEVIDQYDMKVPMQYFCEELLKDQGRIIGCHDTRIQGFEHSHDLNHYLSCYTPAYNHYLRTHLGCTSDSEYQVLSRHINRSWDFQANNTYLNVAPRLSSALNSNSNLSVLVVSGTYDLATPYFATEYTFSRLGLDPSVEAQIEHLKLPGGHMVYADPKNLMALKAKITDLIKK